MGRIMKIRNGFVSNSSSSSFIIGVKGELTEEKLMKSLKVDVNSPLYPLAKGMAQVMLKSEEFTLEELLKDRGCDVVDLTSLEKKIFDKGFKLYQGYAADDGCDPELALCNLSIDYADDEIIISKENSY